MPQISQTIEKLNKFSELPPGWHYGEGAPITHELIEKAENFLRKAQAWSIERSNAFPGINGEVQLTFHFLQKTLSFLWEIDGTITVVEDEKGDILSDVSGLNLETAEDRLWDFSQKIQNLLESYTFDFGTRKITDLKAQPSILQWEKSQIQTRLLKESILKGFLLSQLNASQQQVNRFANTFPDIITTSSVTPQFSGRLKRQTLQNAIFNKRLAQQGMNATITLPDGRTENVEDFSLLFGKRLLAS